MGMLWGVPRSRDFIVVLANTNFRAGPCALATDGSDLVCTFFGAGIAPDVFFRFVPESPRFLVAHGRVSDIDIRPPPRCAQSLPIDRKGKLHASSPVFMPMVWMNTTLSSFSRWRRSGMRSSWRSRRRKTSHGRHSSERQAIEKECASSLLLPCSLSGGSYANLYAIADTQRTDCSLAGTDSCHITSTSSLKVSVLSNRTPRPPSTAACRFGISSLP